MATTVSAVRTFGGAAFSAVADADIQRWLTFAENRLDTTSATWGDDLDEATTLLTLHYTQQFVLSGGAGGATGAISSMKVGNASVSYGGSGSSTSDDYGTTAWGQLFLTMRKSLLLTPMVF